MKLKGVDVIGGILFILGLSGMADAVTGQGSFLVSAIVFGIGLSMSLVCFKGGNR